MNNFTKTLVDKAMFTAKILNDNDKTNPEKVSTQHKIALLPVVKWMTQCFGNNNLDEMSQIMEWMDLFVRDGCKIVSIPMTLAKNLLEANLPTDNKWNFETFGFAGLIEIGSDNYIFTTAITDENNEFVKSMSVKEFALNGKLLFNGNGPIELVKRISYIFRERPNGLIIQENKPSLAAAKKAARKAGKKAPEAVPGTLYIIKEDAALQAKYIKQLQEKAIKKENDNKEKLVRSYRSWRRGHFRNQPIGLRSNKQHELRWIMGHWMGSMDLPIKVQANKIRYVDIPRTNVMNLADKYIFN